MSKPSPAAALIERSKNDIFKVRVLVALSVILHLTATTTMMVMAFYKSAAFGTDFSTTLVLCAFGGLIAVLWASVAAFEVWSVPPVKGHRTLPKWEWHNRHFGLAVGVVFLDTICLLPACFLFVLHSQGQDAFVILKQLAPGDLATVAIFIVVAILLGIVQILSIVHTARQLHLRQEVLESHSSTALRFWSKFLIASKMILEGVFLTLLIVIAVMSGGNSGPILCVIFSAGTGSVFVLCLYHLFKGMNAEDFLTRWRQACVVQCFFTYGEFWVSFIVYLLRRRYLIDFFSSVNNMAGAQRSLLAVALAVMLISIINYCCLLYYHARCMSALDEMGGFAHLEGSSVANLYATTARMTRITAVEMAEQKEHTQPPLVD